MPVGRGQRGSVLIVDEAPAVVAVVARSLQRAGYRTSVAHDGLAALAAAGHRRPDLVVLDVVLPALDGLEVMRRLRDGGGRRLGVILLTARSGEADRVAGLRLGADDYVVKPFSPAELVARVDAVLRRVRPDGGGGSPLRFGDLRIDAAGRRVTSSGREVAMAQREFELLLFLARHPG